MVLMRMLRWRRLRHFNSFMINEHVDLLDVQKKAHQQEAFVLKFAVWVHNVCFDM